MQDSSLGLKANIAGPLCYILGWLSGLIFFFLEKKSSYVKFHAIQSILISLVLTVLLVVTRFIPALGGALHLMAEIITICLLLFLMFMAFKGERFRLPVIGMIAEVKSRF